MKRQIWLRLQLLWQHMILVRLYAEVLLLPIAIRGLKIMILGLEIMMWVRGKWIRMWNKGEWDTSGEL